MLTLALMIGIIIVFVIVLAAIISNKKDKSNTNSNSSNDDKENQNVTDFRTLNKELIENNGNQGIMDLYNTQTSLKKITDIQNINENDINHEIANSNISDNNQDKQS